MLARYAWIAVEKFVERLAGLDVLEQESIGTRVPAKTGVPLMISGDIVISCCDMLRESISRAVRNQSKASPATAAAAR